MQVVTVDTNLLQRALQLYEARLDKGWDLTDCISFVVMQDHQITDAVTADVHFQPAGFRAVLTDQ